MIRERIAEVDRERGRLDAVRSELVRMLERIPEGYDDSSAPWPCEPTFIEIGKGGT
jgi:hypothetical protein